MSKLAQTRSNHRINMSEPGTIEESRTGDGNTQPPRRMLRSIGAVVAGLIVVIVLSLGTDALLHATKIYPAWKERMADSLVVLATAYRIGFAVIGSYVAGRG